MGILTKLKNVGINLKGLTLPPSNKIYSYSTAYNGGFIYNNQKLDRLVNEGYASNTDVYSIISRIIRTGASIPVKITNTKANGDVEIITSGLFYDFIYNPNKKQNRFEFTEDALGYQLATGNEIITGTSPLGFTTQFYTKLNVIPPQLTTVKVIGNDIFENTIQYIVRYKGVEYTFSPEEIMHVKYFNPTILGIESQMGLSPLQAGFNTLTASNEQMVAQATVFKNRGANGMISNNSNEAMGKEEQDDLQLTVQEKLGGADKFNRIVGTTANVKYTAFGLSPADMQLIQSGVVSMRQLCNLYGADSSSFNDPANKTFNNVKEGDKNFYTKAVFPPLMRHYMALNEFVTPGWNKKDNANYSVFPDTSGIEALQDDQNMKVQTQRNLSTGISDVVMRVGEGKISRESAIEIIMISYGLTLEQSQIIVGTTTNPQAR
jgi:HK97 family phage portal protein